MSDRVKQPPAIPKTYSKNFKTLQRAFDQADAYLLSTIDKKTGKPAFLVVAANHDGGEVVMTPFAVMLPVDPDDPEPNPFERYQPPDANASLDS